MPKIPKKPCRRPGKSGPGFSVNPGCPTVALVAMAKWYWDRMAGIYLDGRRYDLALAQARAAAEGTAERWETAGNIAVHLHRFTESRDAYRHAAALSCAGNFAGGIRLKAGYALMKTKDLAHAAGFFSLRFSEDCRAVALAKAGFSFAPAKTAAP